MTGRIILIIVLVFVFLVVILPFALNLAGVNVLQFGSVGGDAASGGVLLRSVDGGIKWLNAAISEDQKNRFPGKIFDLAFHPQNSDILFAGTKSSGLWKSTHAGASWVKVSDGARVLSPTADVYRVVVYPRNPLIMYAAVFQNSLGRVLKTTNGGKTFQEVYFASANRVGVFDLWVDPFDSDHVRIATGQGNILESNNGGRTWRPLKSFAEEITKLLVHPYLSSEMYVLTSRGKLWKSVDGGAQWSELSVSSVPLLNDGFVYSPPVPTFDFFRLGKGIEQVVMDPNIPRRLYASTASGVFRSDDGGSGWKKLEILIPSSRLPAAAIAPHPGDARSLFIGAGVELHRSDDGGEHWSYVALPAKAEIGNILFHPLRPEIVFAVLGR